MSVIPSARALNVFFAVVLAYIAGANHDLVKARVADAAAFVRPCLVAATAPSPAPAPCCPAGACCPTGSCCPAPKALPGTCGCLDGKVCGCTTCRCE